MTHSLSVHSEVGTLRKLIIHSPDGGIGKVTPQKAEELLYDDIVDLPKMQQEYDQYVMTLLSFLDPTKLSADLLSDCAKAYQANQRPTFFIPGSSNYFNSNKVLDTQALIAGILENETTKHRLVTAVCAVENVMHLRSALSKIEDNNELAKILISGYRDDDYLFPPVPNFVFTRDISITVGNHLLLNKAFYKARGRESVLTKYIAYSLFDYDKIISLNEAADFTLLTKEEQAAQRIAIEGGDVMMISPGHLLVGCSERTTPYAVMQLIDILFSDAKRGLINKVSVIQVPPKRDWMHIDTLFTHVSRNCWVMYAPLCSPDVVAKPQIIKTNLLGQPNAAETNVSIHTYALQGDGSITTTAYKTIEALCRHISCHDFNCAENEVNIVYSGGGKFPYDEREQWTDSCNLLALKEGVVVGYDRNRKTLAAFKNLGFTIISSADWLQKFVQQELHPDDFGKDKPLFITIPSSELSRARGGSHCMSMPLVRDRF